MPSCFRTLCVVVLLLSATHVDQCAAQVVGRQPSVVEIGDSIRISGSLRLAQSVLEHSDSVESLARKDSVADLLARIIIEAPETDRITVRLILGIFSILQNAATGNTISKYAGAQEQLFRIATSAKDPAFRSFATGTIGEIPRSERSLQMLRQIATSTDTAAMVAVNTLWASRLTDSGGLTLLRELNRDTSVVNVEAQRELRFAIHKFGWERQRPDVSPTLEVIDMARRLRDDGNLRGIRELLTQQDGVERTPLARDQVADSLTEFIVRNPTPDSARSELHGAAVELLILAGHSETGVPYFGAAERLVRIGQFGANRSDRVGAIGGLLEMPDKQFTVDQLRLIALTQNPISYIAIQSLYWEGLERYGGREILKQLYLNKQVPELQAWRELQWVAKRLGWQGGVPLEY